MGVERDVFPVSIKVGDQRHSRARIFRDGARAVVWADGPRGMSMVADATVVETTKVTATRSVYHLDDGTTWEVMRTGGCGCGSSLRRMSRAEAFA